MKRFIAALLLCSAALVAGEQPQTPTAPKFDQARADAYAKYWQGILQLDDWIVFVKPVKFDDMLDGASAFSYKNENYHWFYIAVLEPSEYHALAEENGSAELTGDDITRDIEDAILHELLHLRLAPLRDSDESHIKANDEYTVVRLTKALLKLHPYVPPRPWLTWSEYGTTATVGQGSFASDAAAVAVGELTQQHADDKRWWLIWDGSSFVPVISGECVPSVYLVSPFHTVTGQCVQDKKPATAKSPTTRK